MQCNCGSETTYHEHEVKTLETAQEWFKQAKETDLPLKIRRDVCKSCGRQFMWTMNGGKYE